MLQYYIINVMIQTIIFWKNHSIHLKLIHRKNY